MWKYYISRNNVFWTNESVDKPSKDYLKQIEWKLETLNVDMTNIYTITFFSKFKDITLLKIENDETNEILYYRFKRIIKYVKNEYLLEYELDNWLTYTLDILDNDIDVLVERHQDYTDEKCLEFRDKYIESLDLSFDNYGFLNRTYFNDGLTHYNTQVLASIKYKNNDDILNGCYCLVINENNVLKNRNTPYLYLPILSKNESVVINNESDEQSYKIFSNASKWYKPTSVSSKQYFIEWWGYETNTYPSTIFEKDKYKFIVDDYFSKTSKGLNAKVSYIISSQNNKLIHKIDISKYLNTYNLKNISILTRLEPLGKGIVTYVYNNGVEIDSDSWHIPISEGIEYDILENGNCKMIFEYYKTVKLTDEIINNSWTNLNELAQSMSNLVVGVFVLPNVFTLSNIWDTVIINNKKYLAYNINQHGSSFSGLAFDLGYLDLNKEKYFDDEKPIHNYVYKYFDCSYLNNPIDISKYFIQDTGVINIADYINFTNSFNLSKENPLVPLDNQLLTLPAQQPYFIDEYQKYVQANMNTVNTGYQINKQQSIISGLSGSANSILGATIASGVSYFKPFFLGTSIASGTLGVSNSIASSILNVKNYEKQIKAAYKDKDNVLGNNLLFSSTQDALFSRELTRYNSNYDSLYIKYLSVDSIKQINNYILLNGLYNPKYFKLNKLPETTKHLGFKYAMLNSNYLNQNLSKYINQPKEVKEIILSQLLEFRLWDIIPELKKQPNN